MNKYQEALNWYHIFSNKDADDELYKELRYDSHDILQELVDKETPMKVELKKEEHFVEDRYFCSKCKNFITTNKLLGSVHYKYCRHCGQRLDWNDEEKC